MNLISEWFIEAANHTCGNFEYGEDEMQLAGLTPLPATKVRAAPRRSKPKPGPWLKLSVPPCVPPSLTASGVYHSCLRAEHLVWGAQWQR